MSERIAAIHGPAFAVFAVLIAALVPFAGTDPTGPVVLAAVVLAVALVGIPHGALDPALARWAGLWSTPLGLVGFLAAYTALALAALGLWMLSPFLALVAFLGLSALHFSGDWAGDLSPAAQLVAGLVVVALPTFFHADAVVWVFTAFAPSPHTVSLVRALEVGAPIVLFMMVGLVTLDLVRKRTRPRVAIELSALSALALSAPPLVYFAVYFAGLHSPRHGIEVMIAFPRRDRRFALAVMAITTIATFAWAMLAWWLMRPALTIDIATLRLVFVGLFVLTVPHMVLCALTDGRVHTAATRDSGSTEFATPAENSRSDQPISAPTSAIASDKSPTI